MEVMQELARDLRDEGQQLGEFILSLSDDAWQTQSPFKSWTIRDVLIHLMVGDRLNVLSMTAADQFQEIMATRRARREAGQPRTSGEEILEHEVAHDAEAVRQWLAGLNTLCDLFADADARARMKWVGPDMSIRSAATARLMETWAHGQDIYDMMRAPRQHFDRVRHIAVLGVNTYNWTFSNRGLETPGPTPRVELKSPSGEWWCWNESETDNLVKGSAVEFCQVVTQGRNIGEVNLEVNGPNAQAWMAIAQCFAGTPEDPPAVGVRGWEKSRVEN